MPPFHRSEDQHGREILTVGQLRGLLEGVDDDRHVVVATEGWYRNVECVGLPDDDSLTCLTFFMGADLDACQY